MGTKFYPAPEVKEIAERIIPLHHPYLVDARVDYVFTDKVPKQGGKEVWGTMRKVTSLTAYLGADSNSQAHGEAAPFFVMVISRPVWDELDAKKREALVDHELCHAFCELDEEGAPKLSIVPHDLEEFQAIVKRHGLWRQDVERFVEATKGKGADEDDFDVPPSGTLY